MGIRKVSNVKVAPLEFYKDLCHQKTTVPGLSCVFVYVMINSAVLIEHWLVTDGWMDTGP